MKIITKAFIAVLSFCFLCIGSIYAKSLNEATAYAYPADILSAQYQTWLDANLNKETGVVQGGLAEYTSEGIGFQMLLSAGMWKLAKEANDVNLENLASRNFVNAYDFVNKNLVNGLLPWSFTGTPPKAADDSSATDADFYIAMGEYMAYEVSGNKDYLNSAQDMMNAIYKLDTTKINGTLVLNCGGQNVTLGKYADIPCVAYTKAILPIMYVFSKVDQNSNNNWNELITNTLKVMKASEDFALKNKSEWGSVLGFISQNDDGYTPGCVFVNYDQGTQSFNVIPEKELENWNFNADAARVPFILGGYLMLNQDKGSDDYLMASELCNSYMKSIDSSFYTGNEGYKAAYGSIFRENSAIAAPLAKDGYLDDMFGGVFFLGKYAQDMSWKTPQTVSLGKFLMNSYSSNYYNAFYKMIDGLIMDNVFGQTNSVVPPFKPNPAPSGPLGLSNMQNNAGYVGGNIVPAVGVKQGVKYKVEVTSLHIS